MTTITETKRLRRTDLGTSRDELTKAAVTRRLTIREALPRLHSLRANDAAGRAALMTETKTVVAQWMMSENGTRLYGLKTTSRVIEGTKRSMLSVVVNLDPAAVLAMEAAR